MRCRSWICQIDDERAVCCLRRKLDLACQLARRFVQQTKQSSEEQQQITGITLPSPASNDLDATRHSVPPAVRSHFAKLLLDWAQSALVKGRIPAAPHASPQEYLQRLSSTWQLLCVMLLSVNTGDAAPNVSLIAAAAAFCKACTAEQAHSLHGQTLAVTLQQTLLVLNTKYKHTFRPSLEHRFVIS